MNEGAGRRVRWGCIITDLECIDALIIAEFRGFVADAMLNKIVCFSAEPYFQNVAGYMAICLGINVEEACDLLLVTSRAITRAATREAEKYVVVSGVCNAAA